MITVNKKTENADVNELCKIISKHNQELQFKLASFMAMSILTGEEKKTVAGTPEFEKQYQKLFDQWRENFKFK